jgi:hypothetical protein
MKQKVRTMDHSKYMESALVEPAKLHDQNYIGLKVEGCGVKDTPCCQEWEQLDRTNDHQVRFCLECCRPVFLVYDESELHVARGNPYVTINVDCSS